MSDTIYELCKKYTDLTEQEIVSIQGMSAVLQPIANLEDADVFVDCPCRDSSNAIVVAEAKPDGVPSSYKKTVVGLLAKPDYEPAVARSLSLGVATKQMKAITQENTHVIQSVEPIKNGSRVIGVLIREKRVDEKRPTSERLHFSEEGYERIANVLSHMSADSRWLTECIDEALILVDKNGIVTYRNTLARNLYKKLGYMHDPLGANFEYFRLIPPPADKEEYGNFSSVETMVGKYYLDVKRVAMSSPDVDYAVIIRDITWKKENEKQLVLKSVAIKEMHHRVKNNLQTIASLLRLQARRTDNEETRRVLAESMNRILSIATTHELLAKSGVDEVNLSEVIYTIKNSTQRYFAKPGFAVTVKYEGENLMVDSDVATAVALIITELLQNSLKYAYDEQDEGQVLITLIPGDINSTLKVADDGRGFDVENTSQSLGMSIVTSLVKDKLRGNLNIESGPEGTTVTFDFNNKTIDIASVT
ncbi:MAG: histidine kinase [Clostridiales bacterium]|nr:histidine kinase [Clostridiales bacterium]